MCVNSDLDVGGGVGLWSGGWGPVLAHFREVLCYKPRQSRPPLHTGHIYVGTCRKHHVMPREKRWELWDSCFRLVGPHQQSIPQFLSLASRVQHCTTNDNDTVLNWQASKPTQSSELHISNYPVPVNFAPTFALDVWMVVYGLVWWLMAVCKVFGCIWHCVPCTVVQDPEYNASLLGSKNTHNRARNGLDSTKKPAAI